MRQLFLCRHSFLFVCLFFEKCCLHVFSLFRIFFTEGTLNQRIIMSFLLCLKLVGFFWILLRSYFWPLKSNESLWKLCIFVNVPTQKNCMHAFLLVCFFSYHSFIQYRAHLFPCNACTMIKIIFSFLCVNSIYFDDSLVSWFGVSLSLSHLWVEKFTLVFV